MRFQEGAIETLRPTVHLIQLSKPRACAQKGPDVRGLFITVFSLLFITVLAGSVVTGLRWIRAAHW